MDRANFELARCLAERQTSQIHLVSHRIEEPLRSHPAVVPHLVPRPGGRHLFGSFLLSRAGRRVAHDLSDRQPYVIVNGGNCRWFDVNWVHYVNACCQNQSRGAPILFRIRNFFSRYRGVRAERGILRQSRLVIANSEKTRRDLIETMGVSFERIRRIYLGVDPTQFSPITEAERNAVRGELSIENNAQVILFVGALGYDRNKGFDTLLAAVKQLKSKIADPVHLLAIGGGKLAYWQKMINAEGLAMNVRLLGSRKDVPRLMAAADVLSIPSRYDSYGLAAHEALCRGLPAVVSAMAGVAERYTIELRDWVLPDPEDTNDLARRLEFALTNRIRFQAALDRLGEQLRSWTWNDMAAEMIRVIETET